MSDVFLGVNIDHVATLRQARGTSYPDPVEAVRIAEQAGADGITLHLREDRRHIQDRDVYLIKDVITTRMNLEMAATREMLAIALDVQPEYCCIVPETREELTTEGGLDVAGQLDKISEISKGLSAAGIKVSLFIDPDSDQIEAAQQAGAPVIELHTGCYADAQSTEDRQRELGRIEQGVKLGLELGLTVNAGHGLHYENVQPVARIPGIYELNIGHAIIARAVFSGLEAAVSDMKRLIADAV